MPWLGTSLHSVNTPKKLQIDFERESEKQSRFVK